MPGTSLVVVVASLVLAAGCVVVALVVTARRPHDGVDAPRPALDHRERQALDLNDSVLQGLVVARMALERGDDRKALEALDTSIAAAGSIITGLMESGRHRDVGHRRTVPAVLTPEAHADEGVA